MTDQEFYEIYGRMPRRPGPKKKKYKIYWHRIIIALVILILLIVGIVKLIGFIIGKIKGSDDKKAGTAANDSSISSEVEDNGAGALPDEGNADVGDISQVEVETKVKSGSISFTVCIDAAHGGYDKGSEDSTGERLEKDEILQLSLKLKSYLESQGVKVIITRIDDTFIEQADRVATAQNGAADLMITLHRGYTDGEYQGIEAYVHHNRPETDTAFAGAVLNSLAKVGVTQNHGVRFGYINEKQVDYYINEYTAMPSLLLNLGYISNDEDNRLFTENFDSYVEAIGSAIINEAVDLGIIDSSGNRLKQGQLISEKSSYYGTETQTEAESNEQVPEYTDDGIGTFTEPMMTGA